MLMVDIAGDELADFACERDAAHWLAGRAHHAA